MCTHTEVTDKDNKNGEKGGWESERGLKLKKSHTICGESLRGDRSISNLRWRRDWEGGGADLLWILNPCKWSSVFLLWSSGYRHTYHSFYIIVCFCLCGILSCLLSKESTFPYILAGLPKVYWALAATRGVHKVIYNDSHDGGWTLKLPACFKKSGIDESNVKATKDYVTESDNNCFLLS